MVNNFYHAGGTHAIIDFWTSENLDNEAFWAELLTKMAQAAGATILHSYFHRFFINGGITGFLALSESHISIHTWPESNYAAIDIFICGDKEISKAIEILEQISHTDIKINNIKRGI